MNFEAHGTYHVYNRSNEKVFLSDDNYLYFLQKLNKLVKPYADILAWCLMPNHFHLLIQAKPVGCEFINEMHRKNTQNLAKNIGTMLSSYSQGFNKQNNRRGKLFAHNTKAKCLNDVAGNTDYGLICFNYIHQNPVEAGLCTLPSEWKYSSYLDYANVRKGTLVNKNLSAEMFNIDLVNFELQYNASLSEKVIEKLY